MLSLAIIEDQQPLREALADYLCAQPEFNCVAIAGSVEELMGQLDTGAMPALVLSDIGLPGASGIEGVRLIRQRLPETEVLLFSVYNDSERVFQALCAGAIGYLLKSTPLPTLKENILQAAAGGSPMSPSIARHVTRFFQPERKPQEPLTPRELQIVQGIEEGLSYKLIAHRLGISIDTVRDHIRRVYRKLQVNSRSEVLARAARRAGPPG